MSLTEAIDTRGAIDARLADALAAWVKQEAERHWGGPVVEFDPFNHATELLHVVSTGTLHSAPDGSPRVAYRFDNAEAAARILVSGITTVISTFGRDPKEFSLVWRIPPEIARPNDYDQLWDIYSRFGFFQHRSAA